MNFDKYDKQHRKSLGNRGRKVQSIIDEARRKAVEIAIASGYDGTGEFHFKGAALEKVNGLLRDTADKVAANIRGGVADGWMLSAEKGDVMLEYVGHYVKLPDGKKKEWTGLMEEALDGFEARKVATVRLSDHKVREMSLSERVWNLSGQFKEELELAVEAGMEKGMSAAELSRKVRKYLNEPDRLFRRVRELTGELDENGKPIKSGVLRLSKAAQAYHPGTGVYRSSYKNALRMTVTEINTAYRTADYLRWKSMPFVLGIEIRITASRHVPDICDDLKGKYPKDFKFTGWHPWCRCYAVPILPSVEEFASFDMQAEHHEGEVTDVPGNFKKWVGKNEGRIAKAKKLPNFLKDNERYWKGKEKGWNEKVATFNSTRRKEYERLKADQSYKDVKFDEKTGGVKATHVGHNFDRHKGWYETTVQEVGYKAGHSVIFESEDHTKLNTKNTEGKWDGMRFEIAAAESNTPNNIRNALKHCAKKPNCDVAIIFFPNKYHDDIFEDGLGKFKGLEGTTQYRKFKIIVCIHDGKIVNEISQT